MSDTIREGLIFERLPDHEYGPHSSGDLISDGRTTQSWDGKSRCDDPQCWCAGLPPVTAPLLYTQAQVDALVQAERERCAVIAEGAEDSLPAMYQDGAELVGYSRAKEQIAARIREGK